ncbi:MAG: NAD(P)H-hydrate dehydratase [Thermodesulfovibrionales bacterium]|nr:NAD(P)H-hydrate dehydratase [Thermodesulfovibrionales bacterium]
MRVVTAEEMRRIDGMAIKGHGIPGAVLMERAGTCVAEKIKELFAPGKIIVLAGPGNNGGDGIVAARELYNSGWGVKVLMPFTEDKLSADCLLQLRTARRLGVPLEFRSKIDSKDTHGALVIDAIFGTGMSKPVAGAVREVISFINASGCPVIAVDMPSGISSDTGEIMGEAVRASFTVTFGLPKRGHLLYPGAECTGRLFVADIGFPRALLDDKSIICRTTEKEDVLIPARPRYSHKGDFGHVLLVAGSRGKTGAALMAAKACLKTGAGLVTIAVPESLMDVMQSRAVEEMTLPLAEAKGGTLSSKAVGAVLKFLSEKADILAIGPGIGATKDTEKLVKEVLKKTAVPSVIDADAVNVLGKDFLKNLRQPFILTPHPGEMARLTGAGAKHIEKDRIKTAISFVKDIISGNKGADCTLVLKGAPTITAGGGEIYINTTGNPGMAKAGTGDVLTGMIAAFLAQGLEPVRAAVSGVYMHGLAGDMAASKTGFHSLLASDIIDAIPEAFKSLTEGAASH